MRKKAQLGQTITWMVGFVIVFFVVILFLTGTLLLAGDKALTSGRDEIVFSEAGLGIRAVESQNFLLNILNGEIEEGEIVKNFIKEGISDPSLVEATLKPFVEEKLERLGKCEYIFLIEYDPENLLAYNRGEEELLYRRVEFGSITSSELLDEGTSLSLFSEEKRIRIKFYLGECNDE